MFNPARSTPPTTSHTCSVTCLGGGRVDGGHHDAALLREVLHGREDGLRHHRVQACMRGVCVRMWARGPFRISRAVDRSINRDESSQGAVPHPTPPKHHTQPKGQTPKRTGAGLVEEDELRGQQQLRRDGEPLALAAGDALGRVLVVGGLVRDVCGGQAGASIVCRLVSLPRGSSRRLFQAPRQARTFFM